MSSHSRILLIGNYKDNPSEGMEVISHKLFNSFKRHEKYVKILKARQIISILLKCIVTKFDCILFTHGPGKGTLILSKLLSLITSSKIIWIASRPDIGTVPDWLIRFTYADRIIIQGKDEKLLEIAHKNKIELEQQIIGIDFDRISSNSNFNVDRVKGRYLFMFENKDRPLLIHVGHIKKNRGLTKLIELKQRLKQRANILVVASPSLKVDKQLEKKLLKKGIGIYRKYIDNLSEIYKLADLYLFPVDPDSSGAVDLPLSVIEALASKTPVVATNFGQLPILLPNFKGLNLVLKDKFVLKSEEMVIKKEYNNMCVEKLPKEFSLDNLAKVVLSKS